MRVSSGWATPHFNPRSPHGERPRVTSAIGSLLVISTHAPRTGSDVSIKSRTHAGGNFNPRSPHGERRLARYYMVSIQPFQPTLPARGATYEREYERGAKDAISTHAPRTGSDTFSGVALHRGLLFQPTLPARGATYEMLYQRLIGSISTHAPRTGSDGTLLMAALTALAFQPTLPARGATVPNASKIIGPLTFQPTLPARGATVKRSMVIALKTISTHAPRTGSDADRILSNMRQIISTHAPRTGSDITLVLSLSTHSAFQPTLPARGATCTFNGA